MMNKFSKLFLSVQAALLATGSLAYAADETPDDSQNDGKLERIMVTAQKRVQNAQEVPMAISALKSGELENLGAAGNDLRFMASRIPSLNIESSFGRTFPRFYIRGMGNTDFDLNSSQPVSLVVDDVVQENSILKGYPIFDMERVEVLRGPQGTLFGRNTTAGIIKLDTKKPTQEFSAYAKASYGTFNTTNLEGAVGGGLTDTVSARLSVLDQQRDDWVDNKAPGFEQKDQLEGYHDKAARLQVLWEPTSDFSALFNAHYRDLDGTPRVNHANAIQRGSNSLVPGFDRDTVYQNAASRAQQDVTTKGGSAKLEYNFGDYTLTSITAYEKAEAYSRADVDGGYTSANPGISVVNFNSESADGLPKHHQLTQELRIASNELGRLDWQAGLFYFDEELNIDSYDFDSNGQVDGYAWQKQDTKAWAAFASVDYDLTDAFKVTAGVRYSHDKKDFQAQREISPIGGGATGILTENPSDGQVSWDLSGVYTINPDMNVYGRIARGFRAPSIQGRLLFGDEVTVADSETMTSAELGIKSDILDNRGRVNFDIYYYQLDDQELTAVGGDTNFNRLVNADKSVGYGAELDSQFAITSNLLVTAGVSYNHTEIKDDQLAVGVCGSQCNVTDPLDANGNALIDGNSLPQAPKWTINMTASYTYPLADGDLFATTDWAYRSSVNFFLYESTEFKSRYLLEGGARAGYRWTASSTDYEVAAYVRNITDTTRVTGAIDFNNLTGFVNDPRVMGVEFKVSFF
ncbi:TonB-dependent receptor [Shewanella sp. C32]|uniref:TonB-dependent receptor n=2 Tax=Shewanella electrica TaxID=515560 RepID=A0ABT2FP87_9GAMM|nr:TonB-dependent receptor [Shewanella electrica]MCH1925934.1 TonB-dependent receptor [Shewanella electrica]MCS4557460.1 TonB-dependent receptor [Shewanella electrica]